jgi:hypothetical protein
MCEHSLIKKLGDCQGADLSYASSLCSRTVAIPKTERSLIGARRARNARKLVELVIRVLHAARVWVGDRGDPLADIVIEGHSHRSA